MLKTALKSKRSLPDENWDYAVRTGFVETYHGHKVLQLGQADYVVVNDRLYSINGDFEVITSPELNAVKGVRWEVEKIDGHWNVCCDLDRLAIEFFFKELIPC